MILAKLIRLDDPLFSETILYVHSRVPIQVEDNMRHIVSATGLCLLCPWPSADAGDTQESYPPLQLGAESSTRPHGPRHLFRPSFPSVSTH